MQKFEHYTLTLAGTSTMKTLADVIPAGQEIPNVYAVWVQAATGNSNPIYIGGLNATVTTTNYAVYIPAPAATIPAAPFSLGDVFPYGALDLRAIRVIGTNNEKLQIGIVPIPS